MLEHNNKHQLTENTLKSNLNKGRFLKGSPFCYLRVRIIKTGKFSVSFFFFFQK